MSMTSPDRITLSPTHQQQLAHQVRACSTAQQLVRRDQIVLPAGKRCPKAAMADRVGMCVDTVSKRRHRWWAEPGPASLSDAKRSRRPPSFTSVQVAAVKALACQPPEVRGVPLSRWSCQDLAA